VATLNPWHLSEPEFDAVMNEIDAELRLESDTIVDREIRGWLKFCQLFKVSLNFDDPLAERVFDWFKRINGERLNLDADFGKSFVLIRGDAYRLRCFRIYGAVYAICSVDTLGRKIRQRTPYSDYPDVNLLDDDVEGLTPELARRLLPTECAAILTRYYRVFRAFTALEGALASRHGGEEAPYMKEAINDLLEASECILRRTAHYGQSNWAALQAVEKCLKSYILEKDGSHGKIHDLKDLAEHAAKLGLPALEPQLIAAIQCRPDVRYDAELVSRDKALAAYQAALVVCADIGEHIRPTTARASIAQIRIRIGRNEPHRWTGAII
jgi:HEPN domain-containing protein